MTLIYDDIQARCPRLKSAKFEYELHGRRPHRNAADSEDRVTAELGGHLAALTSLPDLTELAITAADFYSHSLFSLLRSGPTVVPRALFCDP